MPSRIAFSVVEWLSGVEQDLHLVRCCEGHLGEPQRLAHAGDLEGAGTVICFRPSGLTGLHGTAWRRLEEAGLGLDGSFIARICLPTAESYELDALGAQLGIAVSSSNAADRAAAAGRIVARLLERLDAVPLPILGEMERLLATAAHPLRSLVSEAARRALARGFGRPHGRFEDLLAERDAEARVVRTPREPPAPLDPDAICEMFGPDGPLASHHPRYESRPEQVRMAREVAEAFNDALVLLAEAGTGTGKSLAYLVPAAAWSLLNDEPVVVSTHTKNLQAQLRQKDLPYLEKAFGNLRFAVVKGRGNYLCLRQLRRVLAGAAGELSPTQLLEILPVLAWLAETRTGDIAENSGFRPGPGSDTWEMLAARSDECQGPACGWWRWCFVRLARARAAAAHIVVANHATVFSDAASRFPLLPEHRCIIFDEAHSLEDVAATCLGVVIDSVSLARLLARVWGAGGALERDTSRSAKRRRRSSIPSPAGAGKVAESAMRRLSALPGKWEALFSRLSGLFAGTEDVERIRCDAGHLPEGWSAIVQAATEIRKDLEELADDIEKMRGDSTSSDNENPDKVSELAARAPSIRALADSLDRAVRTDDEQVVRWVERDLDGRGPALCVAPLDIADMMNSLFYGRKRTVIFTSATLTVGGSFDFIRSRLGLHGPVAQRIRTVELGTSFDLPRQVLAIAPLFLPEPRGRADDFVAPFCELALDLLEVSRGRGLVLFTSHAMLRDAAPRLARLSEKGFPVLAQGIDGGRDQLLIRFTRETASVLLGTQSFWEGVDVPGESLSCLILARLPFRPPDPLVNARCERIEAQGGNAFRDYVVPDAAIRLRQGFGRLIRSRQDRGVVVICDRRLFSRPYGRTFLKSLPVEIRTFKDAPRMIAAVQEFLNASHGP